MNDLEFLTLTRDLDGSYFISDHNNEKLDVIATLYLDKKTRSNLLKNFDNFHDLKSEDGQFKLLRKKNIIIILQYKKDESLLEEDNPLEVTIDANKLREIFETIKKLEQNQVHKIIIAKQQDNYVIEAQE